jgi:hypothetical protein
VGLSPTTPQCLPRPSQGEAASVLLRVGETALANDRIGLLKASSETRTFLIVLALARRAGGSRMDRAPGRFVGSAYPYVAIDPALDNEYDPMDQDSRTSFPDKSLTRNWLNSRAPPEYVDGTKPRDLLRDVVVPGEVRSLEDVRGLRYSLGQKIHCSNAVEVGQPVVGGCTSIETGEQLQ